MSFDSTTYTYHLTPDKGWVRGGEQPENSLVTFVHEMEQSHGMAKEVHDRRETWNRPDSQAEIEAAKKLHGSAPKDYRYGEDGKMKPIYRC